MKKKIHDLYQLLHCQPLTEYSSLFTEHSPTTREVGKRNLCEIRACQWFSKRRPAQYSLVTKLPNPINYQSLELS